MNKYNKVILLISIIFCISIVKFNTVSNASESKKNISSNISTEIDNIINDNMEKGKIPGVSVEIVKGDKTIYEKGFGYSDLNKKTNVTCKTLFEIGSNSKSLTALGVLNLYNNGLIDLSDDVSKYIDWFSVNYEGKKASITIEQLLHQTSGIPFNTIANIPEGDKDNSLEDTVKTLVELELDSEPGKQFQYATINYDVLGLVIQNVSGMSYEEYIKTNILEKMRLNNTYMYKSKVPSDLMATGYKPCFFKQTQYDAPVYRGNKPAGYIISCGEDMAKYLKVELDALNTKMDKNIILQSQDPNRTIAPMSDGASYAAGWFAYQEGKGKYTHEGSNPNFSSYLVFSRENNIGISVLCNSSSDHTSKIAEDIYQLIDENKYVETTDKDFNLSVDKISSISIIVGAFIIVLLIYMNLSTVVDIIKRKRNNTGLSLKRIVKIIISFMFICCLMYGIYIIPYIYEEVSWSFVSVWMPSTIIYLKNILYTIIVLVYLYIILNKIFKKKQDKALFSLALLGTISGIGNYLIIFVINIAISVNNETRIKLIVYFIIGILLYVYGQKIMRENLIDYTNKMVYEKRMNMIEIVLATPFNNFEKIEKGTIQSTLSNDTEKLSGFANALVETVTSLITLICCFIYLGYINKFAILLALFIIIVIISIYYIFGRHANYVGEQARDIQNIFFDFINDMMIGFKELILNQKRKKEFKNDMQDSCDTYRVKKSKASKVFAKLFVIGELLFTVAIGGIVFVFPLIFEDLDSAKIASYVFILLYMTGPINVVLGAIPNLIDVKISYNRINELIGKLLKNENEEEYGEYTINNHITLGLNNIEYYYDNEDKNSFKIGPINYEFKSGEIVFITGGNGSGKSTLSKIITGLYKQSGGYITINGEKINNHNLRELFSTVFADFHLFKKLYGINIDEKEDQINNYLKILGLDKKVEINNGEFSTIQLSTGQKKRLALLVAYLEDRPIYLFDEWAADQDPDFRLFFYEELLPQLRNKGKCVIAVTHDDRYFDLADKVMKMEFGQIK